MNDYIKQSDVLEICEWYQQEYTECAYALDNLTNEMRRLHPADVVERKSGKCLPKARYFYCSECGYAVADVYERAYDHDDEKVFVFEKGESWHYCPNCGAEMREPEKEAWEQ